MATEFGKDFSWQDMPLYQFEETGWLLPPRLSYYPDTNSASTRNTLNKIGNKMATLYVNISKTMVDKNTILFLVWTLQYSMADGGGKKMMGVE
jgi:hypothetical protein